MSDNSSSVTNVSSVIADATAAATAAASPRGRGRPVVAESKLNQARQIFNSSQDKSRKTLVAAFVTNIEGISKTVAGAYYHVLSRSNS